MIRLYALLTSSHFAAWMSGAFATLALTGSARRAWDSVLIGGVWCVVCLLVMRRLKRDEAKEAARVR